MNVEALYGLRLRTPRLELRLGSRDELVELFRVAEAGIHPPGEMPFAVAWTDDLDLDRFVEHHEGRLAEWRPEAWMLNLLVFVDNRPIGSQSVGADRFAEERRVVTGSWLGQPFQRRGFGTEMRAAVLELAFAGLGAEAAESGALDGNRASERVSEKLGYERAGEGTQAPRGVPVREQRFRLRRTAWHCPVPVEISGLEPCLPLFGVGW